LTRQLFIWTTFLTLTVAFTSCNGQVKTDAPNDTHVKLNTGGQPRKSRGLLQDKEGNFWFTNLKGGVRKYDGKSFTHFTEKDGLSNNGVCTILEDNLGKLWLGTTDGVTVYDGKMFTIIPITFITGNTNYHKTTTHPTYGVSSPMENFVLSMLQDSRGVFWFGTPVGIYLYDPSKDNGTGSRTFLPFLYNDSIHIEAGTLGVESIIEDTAGNIWFGGRGIRGVFRFDGKALTNYNPNGENWVCPLLQDKTGTIWFSTRAAGLYRYDGETFSFFGKGEFNDFFFSIEEDDAGNIWFGNGKNGGVTFYDGKSFINYNAKDGLFDELMGKVLESKDGSIWFSNKSDRLFRYDGKTFACYSE